MGKMRIGGRLRKRLPYKESVSDWKKIKKGIIEK